MGIRKGFLEEIMLELRCEGWESTDQAEKVKRERGEQVFLVLPFTTASFPTGTCSPPSKLSELYLVVM